MYQVKCSSAIPPADSTSRISSVAYATDDNASEANTGRAIFFGSVASPSISLRTGVPTRTRFNSPIVDGTIRMLRLRPCARRAGPWNLRKRPLTAAAPRTLDLAAPVRTTWR
jgi:hypothetical protein